MGHAFGKIDDTTEIVKIKQKGLHLNTLENFYKKKTVPAGNPIKQQLP
jgi:hypothetical protein